MHFCCYITHGCFSRRDCLAAAAYSLQKHVRHINMYASAYGYHCSGIKSSFYIRPRDTINSGRVAGLPIHVDSDSDTVSAKCNQWKPEVSSLNEIPE